MDKIRIAIEQKNAFTPIFQLVNTINDLYQNKKNQIIFSPNEPT